MLSKELKELEINQLVKRTVLDTQPITVQYELTEHGNTPQTIISNLTDRGITFMGQRAGGNVMISPLAIFKETGFPTK
jgi:DNA-binding HxlR family transcriptional regulator